MIKGSTDSHGEDSKAGENVTEKTLSKTDEWTTGATRSAALNFHEYRSAGSGALRRSESRSDAELLQ